MSSTSVKDNNLDFAIRRFNNQVAKSGTLTKAREIANGYRSKGVKKREERKQNQRNSRKNRNY